MTIAELITYTRNQAGASSGNFSDAEMLVYLNIAYHDMENRMASVLDEDYFWDVFTADTVVDQNEYTLQATAAGTEGIKKINRVEVKRETADDYNTLLEVDTLSNWKKSDGYMQAKVSTTNPRFEHRDGSIFVYPAPDSAVTNGLKVHATKALIDLVDAGAEVTIFPNHTELRQYHYIVGMGAVPHILRERRLLGENAYQSSKQLYEQELARMLNDISNRVQGPITGTLPDGRNFKR